MGQREILAFLASNPNKEFTRYQLEDALKISARAVDTILATLRKNGEVLYHEGPRAYPGGKETFYYKHKKNENFKIIFRKRVKNSLR